MKINGKSTIVPPGLTLSEIIKGEKPCGGHGRCGKCKVIARGAISSPSDSEIALLSKDELARVVRLACLTYALGNCEVEDVPCHEAAQIMTDGVLTEFKPEPSFSKYGVAIDIGTTTIAAQLYDREANLLSQAACLNPQSK